MPVTTYATIPDLYLHGFREEARGDLTDAHLNAALSTAFDVINGYLVVRYGEGSMPLVTFTDEVKRWQVALATFELMTGPRGLSSEGVDYLILKDRSDAAHRMLGRIQRRDYTPVGLVTQQALGTTGIQPFVTSNTPRGW